MKKKTIAILFVLIAALFAFGSTKPESGGGTGNSGTFLNTLMVHIARWLYRFSLLMCAILLIKGGIASGITNPVSWPLLTGGTFLIISEIVFIWFKYLEKK